MRFEQRQGDDREKTSRKGAEVFLEWPHASRTIWPFPMVAGRD
jgi:hypothetical protein